MGSGSPSSIAQKARDDYRDETTAVTAQKSAPAEDWCEEGPWGRRFYFGTASGMAGTLGATKLMATYKAIVLGFLIMRDGYAQPDRLSMICTFVPRQSLEVAFDADRGFPKEAET